MHRLQYRQLLPLSLDECWDFFSNPDNLPKITPSRLGFQNNEVSMPNMYAGQIIVHTLRPICNIPIVWVTEITHIQEKVYFIDEQRIGPYRMWHHEHRFVLKDDEVEMIDTVHYKMPFGFVGELFHTIKLGRDIEEIFSFRKKKLEELFGVSKLTNSLQK